MNLTMRVPRTVVRIHPPRTVGSVATLDRRTRIRLVRSGAAVALALAAIGMVASVSSAEDLTVTVGAGDGTVAAQAFMPGDITIEAGDRVTFVIGSDDPHTITLGTGPEDAPPSFWPAAGFEAPAGPPPFDLGVASFDGSGFVNTGILFGKGSQAGVTFPEVGTFSVFCAIHPGMAGTVTVVASGPVTSQGEADIAAAATRELLLDAVEPARTERSASIATEVGPDGTTTVISFADAGTPVAPMPGGGSGYLELNEFFPSEITIAAGDTITWSADRIHTVTFLPEGVDRAAAFPDSQALLGPAGGSTYDGTAVTTSGVFNFSPAPGVPPLTSYSLTFPVPGTYPFFCALHAEIGQLGVVIVQ